MTNESLDDLINLLNTKKFSTKMVVKDYKCKIKIKKKKVDSKKKVFYAIVYVFNKKSSYTDSCRFYFIRNKNKFIGIIQDGGSNLHWYLKKGYRGNGYMYNALKLIIFRILLKQEDQVIEMDSCEEQCNFEKSKALALKIGFEEIDRKEDREPWDHCYKYRITRKMFLKNHL